MAMFKRGHAAVIETGLTSDQWVNAVYETACADGKCRMKTARSVIAKYDPRKYLLSHCSIIAAVDVDEAPSSIGPYKDYLIKPEFSKFVNNNGDAWTKSLLAAAYKTFIGANNYLEHVQISELSKGKVIDAVLREIPIAKTATGQDLSTYYVDILVATDRKHGDLVRKIEANELATLSMGCCIAFSVCSKCGKVAKDETEACQHVRYEKNNTFYDSNGIQRRVAELCGHVSDPTSVKFVDASWVRTPAFTGAVKRNTVEPSADVLAKLEKALSVEGYQKKEGDFLKAAGFPGIVVAQDPPPEEPPAEAPVEEPPAEAPVEEPPAEDPPAEEPGVAPAEEPPAEELPAEEPEPPAEEESPVKKLKKDITQKLLQQIGDEILSDFSGETDMPSPETTTLDETIIKPASVIKQAYRVWTQRLKQAAPGLDKDSFAKLRLGTFGLITSRDPSCLAGYSKRDFVAVLAFLDKYTSEPLSAETRTAVLKVGTADGGPVETSRKLVEKLGRKMTLAEGKKAYIWLKLLDLQETLS